MSATLTTKEKRLLDAFGEAWLLLDAKLNELVQEASDDELAAFQRAFAKLTTTNCWYATWDARQASLAAISREMYARAVSEAQKETPDAR